MDTIFYNNGLARFLYSLLGNKSYAIGPFIFTTLEAGSLGTRSLNHLLTHTRQWMELFVLVMFIGLFVCGFSLGLIELAILAYYIWYMIEFAIRTLMYRLSSSTFTRYGRLRALELMSFEMEAMEASRDPHYHQDMNIFGWLRHLV